MVDTTSLIGLAADKTWKEMLRTPNYYVIVGIFAIGSTSGLMIMGHAAPIIQETLKVSSSTAAFVVGLIAIANTIGRLFWGWLSDRIGRYLTINILFVIVIFSMAIMATMSQVLLFVAMILAIGLCYGGFAALMAPLTADTFGIKHLSENYGFMYFAYGIGGVLGPRLAAIARDLNQGDYTWAFVIAAILSIIGIVLSLFALRMKRSTLEIKPL
jgi:OFA family oxalate/formate antiporter-like MFS transporter